MRLLLSALAALFLVPGALADTLRLKDGRFVDGVPIKEVEGGIELQYKNGKVFVPEKLVGDYLIFDAENFVPKTPEEKEKFEQGLVPFEGKWISKSKMETLVKKRKEETARKLEELRERSHWRNRYKKETKHFKFEYTVPDDICQKYIDLLETYYKVFTKKWGIKNKKKIKLPVCIYKDYKSFLRTSMAGYGTLGYFRFVDPIELDLFYSREEEEYTTDILFHEGNHYLTYLIDPKFRYPHWINEALAEYYGASTWDPKTKKMTVGHIQDGRLVEIKDDISMGNWKKLDDLIGVRHYDSYTWGWSFVHFLMETKKYSKKFQKYYLALAKDPKIPREDAGMGFRQVSPEEQKKAFLRYMKIKDLKGLEKEWHDYVKEKLKFEGPRGYERAANKARIYGETIKAKRYFAKAVELGSTTPGTYHQYAKLLIKDKKTAEQGIEIMKKGIELDPLNARFYATLARGIKKLKPSKKRAWEPYVKLAAEMAPEDYDLQWELSSFATQDDDEDEEDDES